MCLCPLESWKPQGEQDRVPLGKPSLNQTLERERLWGALHPHREGPRQQSLSSCPSCSSGSLVPGQRPQRGTFAFWRVQNRAWLWAARRGGTASLAFTTRPPDPPKTTPKGPLPLLPQTQPEIFLGHLTQLPRPEPAPQPFWQHLLKLQDRPGSLGTETSLSTSLRSQPRSTVVHTQSAHKVHTLVHVHISHKCMHT